MLSQFKKPDPEQLPVDQALEGLGDAFTQATQAGESVREEALRAFVAGLRLGASAAFDHARRTAELANKRTNTSLDVAFDEIEKFISQTMNRIQSEPMESPESLAKRFNTPIKPEVAVKPVSLVKREQSVEAPILKKDAADPEEVLELTNMIKGLDKKG